jgi:hypothetical protein
VSGATAEQSKRGSLAFAHFAGAFKPDLIVANFGSGCPADRRLWKTLRPKMLCY